tara:strand:- start:5 stop:190 length:186 start_codon:yes stop_codon:yes gene_type:complete
LTLQQTHDGFCRHFHENHLFAPTALADDKLLIIWALKKYKNGYSKRSTWSDELENMAVNTD